MPYADSKAVFTGGVDRVMECGGLRESSVVHMPDGVAGGREYIRGCAGYQSFILSFVRTWSTTATPYIARKSACSATVSSAVSSSVILAGSPERFVMNVADCSRCRPRYLRGRIYTRPSGLSWSAIDMPYADSKAVFNGTVLIALWSAAVRESSVVHMPDGVAGGREYIRGCAGYQSFIRIIRQDLVDDATPYIARKSACSATVSSAVSSSVILAGSPERFVMNVAWIVADAAHDT